MTSDFLDFKWIRSGKHGPIRTTTDHKRGGACLIDKPQNLRSSGIRHFRLNSPRLNAVALYDVNHLYSCDCKPMPGGANAARTVFRRYESCEVASVADKPIAIVTVSAPAPGPRLSGVRGRRISHHRLARSPDRIRGLEQELPRHPRGDLRLFSSENQVADAVANVRNYMGPPNVSYITR